MNYLTFVLIGFAIILGIVFLAILLFKLSKLFKNKKISKFFEKSADFLMDSDPQNPP